MERQRNPGSCRVARSSRYWLSDAQTVRTTHGAAKKSCGPRFVIRSDGDRNTNVVLCAGMRWSDGLSFQRLTRSKGRHEPTTVYVGGVSRRIHNMRRAILVVATTLILTAGQAMADGLTPSRQVNLRPDDFHPPQCYCTCLENGCCPHCP